MYRVLFSQFCGWTLVLLTQVRETGPDIYGSLTNNLEALMGNYHLLLLFRSELHQERERLWEYLEVLGVDM